MARITVEDSLLMAKNRFALVLLTAQRTRQLLKGSRPLTDTRNNREIVSALREIAAGKGFYSHPHYPGRGKEKFKSIPHDTEVIREEG